MNKEIFKGYKDKEKRRQYMREYNRYWRKTERGRRYHREYMRGRRLFKGEISTFDKDNTCSKGRKWELFALSLLKGSLDNNKESFSNPYDILWNNLRIDVKSREIKQDGSWSFNRLKTCTADYFLCICLVNNVIFKILLIPKYKYKNGISIGKKSKFDTYTLT